MSHPPDPERLAHAAARSELGELFASAERELPSDEQLARLAQSLGPVLDGAAPAPGASLLVKLGAAGGTLALLVGAALTLHRPAAPTPAAVSSLATPKAIASAAPAAAQATSPSVPVPGPEADGASPSASASANTAELEPPSAANEKPASATHKPPTEAGLLEQARRSLNSSPAAALQLANQHAARFPHGVLTQEREVIAIEALRRLQRTSEADRRAASFSRAFPGSAHQRLIEDPARK